MAALVSDLAKQGQSAEIPRLLSKIEAKTARIVVIGVGYVGLPLSVEFARAGFRTTGLDTDAEKARLLNGGESYVADVQTSDLAPLVKSGRLDATTDASVLRDTDVVIVCVPTPLSKTKDPDMRFILAATEEIARHQHDGMLVVLESTTYPGTTTELLVPKLTANGAVLGSSVFIAFSPERVDPGNELYKIQNTPKVIGGASPGCLVVAKALYAQIVDVIVPVSSTATAEMVKLLENTFRAVNIALVNEVAMLSRKLGVDPFEVIHAAATKPFGYMPFYPGPGLGGHCIPVDPLYLSWKLRTFQYESRFIELAHSVNGGMPDYVVERISESLNEQSKPLRGSSILLYGVAYKPDVSDCRESPAFGIAHGLLGRGALLSYMDPFVDSFQDGANIAMRSVDSSTHFGDFDAVVIVTDHSEMPRERVLREAQLVVDTRDALRNVAGDRSKVHGL